MQCPVCMEGFDNGNVDNNVMVTECCMLPIHKGQCWDFWENHPDGLGHCPSCGVDEEWREQLQHRSQTGDRCILNRDDEEHPGFANASAWMEMEQDD